MEPATSKVAPVIVITGTPGTGKSTHAHLLAEESPIPLKHINVGEWIKEKGLHEGFDAEWQTYTVDEDRVCDVRFATYDPKFNCRNTQTLN